MIKELCTVYDCEFDLYHDAVIKDDIVYALDKEGNSVPVRDYICPYVDFDMVQFYTGFDGRHVAPERDNSKWGYVQLSTGKIIVPPKYDYALPFYGNRASVKTNNKYGFIDPKGSEIVELIWDDTDSSFYKGLCWVKKDSKFGYIDERGTIVLPLQFENAEQFERIGKDNNGDYEYTALVKKDGKYGYIDIKGNYIIEPSFDEVKKFWFKDYIAVKAHEKWKFISKRGELVSAFEFDDVGESGVFSIKEIALEKKLFSGAGHIDFYTVKKGGKWGIMFENSDIVMLEGHERYVVYRNMKIYIKDGHVTSMRKLKTK